MLREDINQTLVSIYTEAEKLISNETNSKDIYKSFVNNTFKKLWDIIDSEAEESEQRYNMAEAYNYIHKKGVLMSMPTFRNAIKKELNFLSYETTKWYTKYLIKQEELNNFVRKYKKS